jgi:phospholipid/cholesterol/gamma-HCH transport system ATP-binding protein
MEKIRISNLSKKFGSKQILDRVDLRVNSGEIICIIGKSGSGKSVLMKHLIGIFQPDNGEIFVDGENYTHADEKSKNNIESKYGILFQGAALFDSMNIYENIAFGLKRINTDETEIKSIVIEMLDKVGLRGIEDKMPGELSGGMQKRVGLARSLALKPEIMLYDEPTTGVDPITAGAVDKLISKMNDTFKITSIVVTHDMKSAYRIADRIAMLNEGKIIFTGTPEDIKNTENLYVKQLIRGKADGPIKLS